MVEGILRLARGARERLRSILHERRFRNGMRAFREAGATIGERCFFANVPLYGSEPFLISIGDDVHFGPDVRLLTHDGGNNVFKNLEPERYRNVWRFGRIDIRNNCTIGAAAIILPGVSIGPDSVVAAGAVVTRSIPPGVLVAGNPAEPVMTIGQYAAITAASISQDFDLEECMRDRRAYLSGRALRMSAPVRPSWELRSRAERAGAETAASDAETRPTSP